MKRKSPTEFPNTFRQRIIQVTLTLLAFVFVFPTGGAAQETGCTYDLCALRISGREVRRGAADERVDGFSFFGGTLEIPMLSGRADSAGIDYEAFRKLNNRGVWLQRVAMATTLAGLIVIIADPEDNVGWGMGLTLGAYVPLFWGGSYRSRALDRLQRAIWWYNRGF